MKSYIIIDTNQDLIFPLVYINNTYTSKIALKVKPLGDTRSTVKISMEVDHFENFKKNYNKSWMKSICIVLIDGANITTVQYYGVQIMQVEYSELNHTDYKNIVEIDLSSDYHEVLHDGNEQLLSLFKSWERHNTLNQLGI